MKIIESAILTDGTEVILVDWTDHNTKEFPELYGYAIHAYPIAKNTSSNGWIRGGEKFLLMISKNIYKNYNNSDVKTDYERLKNGSITLQDLSDKFYNGDRDKYLLGMI